jgi:hypothetical protein
MKSPISVNQSEMIPQRTNGTTFQHIIHQQINVHPCRSKHSQFLLFSTKAIFSAGNIA